VSEMAFRVSEGAKWMDRHRPGWFETLDIELLDISECDVCVLGQICGGFSEVVPPDGTYSSRGYRWAAAHGFAVFFDRYRMEDTMTAYDALRENWITEVLSRQFAARESQSAESQPATVAK
jgi:hypothetical protein